jgi:hypothetical protein
MLGLVRSAVRWTPQLMNPTAVGNPAECRWGFVPQPVMKDLLGDRSQHQRYGIYYHTDVHVSNGTLKEFERPVARYLRDRFGFVRILHHNTTILYDSLFILCLFSKCHCPLIVQCLLR